MACRHDHPIECVGMARVVLQSLEGQRELACVLIVGNAAYGGIELDPRPHAGILGASGDVVVEHLARREGRYRLLEMMIEGVVGELQNFLGSIRPQIAVHAGMNQLAKFIGARAPSVVPQAAPIALLLEADNLGDLSPLGFRLLECAQLAEPAGPRSDDGDTTGHDFTPLACSTYSPKHYIIVNSGSTGWSTAQPIRAILAQSRTNLSKESGLVLSNVNNRSKLSAPEMQR